MLFTASNSQTGLYAEVGQMYQLTVHDTTMKLEWIGFNKKLLRYGFWFVNFLPWIVTLTLNIELWFICKTQFLSVHCISMKFNWSCFSSSGVIAETQLLTCSSISHTVTLILNIWNWLKCATQFSVCVKFLWSLSEFGLGVIPRTQFSTCQALISYWDLDLECRKLFQMCETFFMKLD